MRFLLRPGWLALVAAVVAFVVACYTLLAPWQFRREAERDAQQAAIDRAAQLAPVPFAELVPAGAGVGPSVEWRRAQVSGAYVPEAEALVRLRVVDGKPAYEVLTPLRTDDGRVVLVDRGSVEAADGRQVPDFPAAPAGSVLLTGQLRQDETDPQARPVLDADGHRQLYAADSRPLAAATGLAITPGRVQLAAGQPGVLDPAQVTAGEGGAPFTNLSYALQWLTFGAVAVAGLAIFVRLELLQRRRRRGTDGDPDDPGAEGPDGAGETPLADRYGRR